MTTPAEDATLAKIIARHDWATSHGVTSHGHHQDIGDLLRMLRAERANSDGLRKALEAMLAIPEISDVGDEDKEDETRAAESRARRALARLSASQADTTVTDA